MADNSINKDFEQELDENVDNILRKNESWKAISSQLEEYNENGNFKSNDIVYTGENLKGGNFSNANLQNANFSGSNLQEADLTNANLQNVDFTGADLSGADLSGANLDGANFICATLIGTNFTGAHMHGVKFKNADLQDAILLGADLDSFSIEELQELVEFLAKYYPHKLNLSRLNLTMLDLKRIDLSQVNLRGVDFTGCDFTGINIYELDLSECIISPAQIAQALGYIPELKELEKILAPKKKKGKFKGRGIDLTAFFQGGNRSLDWDATKGGISIEALMKNGKAIINSFKKEDTDEKIMEKFNEKHNEKSAETENKKDELRKNIEKYKQDTLERMKKEKNASRQHNIKANIHSNER